MSPSTTALASRVLMLGIDGLSSSFLRAPLVTDNMPILSSLIEKSASGPLWSTFPPYTGPAVDQHHHGGGARTPRGVFGFTDRGGTPMFRRNRECPQVVGLRWEGGGPLDRLERADDSSPESNRRCDGFRYAGADPGDRIPL